MLTMDQIHTIRELYYNQGQNLATIAAKVGRDWRTVRKYVDLENFSPQQPRPDSQVRKGSKLDPFKPLIDQWLRDDMNSSRKQRHTARKIFERLQDVEGFNCSYHLVTNYVAKKKEELNLKKSNGHLPLIHSPGEAQVDFGTASFYENGYYYENGKYLVLSFPYSNGAYMQLNYGENMECLLEGLQTMFEYIEGVPPEIWFDNASTIVKEIMKGGGRKLTRRFTLFQEHYRFKAVFMNPESGWEKGNVENKVGYLRRNFLVPTPRFVKLKEKNKELLSLCDKDMEREHYDKHRSISELFKEDKSALIPLPSVRFDTADYGDAMTDMYGKFTLDKGLHRYSAAPEYAEQRIRYKLTSNEIIVFDKEMHEIVRHRRLYGENELESMDWIPYLKYISKRPRSLKNSGIYDMMPENMRKFMDTCAVEDRGAILKALSELTDRTGFDSALHTVSEAIQKQVKDPDSLKSLYRCLYSGTPVIPPLDSSVDVPLGRAIPLHDDLSSYDAALKGGAKHD